MVDSDPTRKETVVPKAGKEGLIRLSKEAVGELRRLMKAADSTRTAVRVFVQGVG
jgi:hypothetical protein